MQLLAVITVQFATGGISLAPDSSSATLQKAAAEMDRMLDAFLRWEAGVMLWTRAQAWRCGARAARVGARWQVWGCRCPQLLVLLAVLCQLPSSAAMSACLPACLPASHWPAKPFVKSVSPPACSCTCPAGLRAAGHRRLPCSDAPHPR